MRNLIAVAWTRLHVRRSWTIPFTLVLLSSTPVHAQAGGYLNGAQLGYDVPSPPTAMPEVAMDLEVVRTLRAVPGSREEDAAIGDAQAYKAPDLVVRFGDPAHLPLNGQTRPVLVYILSRTITDLEGYAKTWKHAYPRPRPYIEDVAIQPCYPRYLNPQESYPSGHAANGMIAGLLIAEVIPARQKALIARGVRYGDNRVACGVHHPSDVHQGRMLAAAYATKLLKNPAFQADLECARMEQRRAEQAEIVPPVALDALPARCAALRP